MATKPAHASLTALREAQRTDGSWGRSESPSGRIVATIFAARSLQESETTDGALSLEAALDFLTRIAIVDGGGSIGGTRTTVLSCYTGMLAQLFIGAGQWTQATRLVEWIVRCQPISFGDRVYHHPPAEWGGYLTHRYGGCMATTTCLLGLVPTIGALAAARNLGFVTEGEQQVAAFRQLLIDRRLMYGRSGTVIPLSGRTKADPLGTAWVLPAFPRDYVIDLLDLVQVARDVGVPWEAMAEAEDLIRSWQLTDGTWPLLGRRRIEFAYRPERVDRSAGSTVITGRVEHLGLPT